MIYLIWYGLIIKISPVDFLKTFSPLRPVDSDGQLCKQAISEFEKGNGTILQHIEFQGETCP